MESNIFAIAGLVTGGVLGLIIFTGILLLARANARDHQRAWDELEARLTSSRLPTHQERVRKDVEDDNPCGEDCHCINCTEARIVLAQPEPRV